MNDADWQQKLLELQESLTDVKKFVKSELDFNLPNFKLTELPEREHSKDGTTIGDLVEPSTIRIYPKPGRKDPRFVMLHEVGEYIFKRYSKGMEEAKKCQRKIRNRKTSSYEKTRLEIYLQEEVLPLKEGWCEYFAFSAMKRLFYPGMRPEEVRKKKFKDDDVFILLPSQHAYYIGFYGFVAWEDEERRCVLREGLGLKNISELLSKSDTSELYK